MSEWTGRWDSCLSTYNDGYDFEQAEPVLELAICLDRSDVDTDQNDPKYQAEGPSREVVRPVLQNQLQSNQVGGSGHGVIEPVIPRKGEAEGIVDKAAKPRVNNVPSIYWFSGYSPSKGAETTSDGYKRCHLTKTQHRDKDNGSNNQICDQHRGRPTGR